jgi:hypothetical protein
LVPGTHKGHPVHQGQQPQDGPFGYHKRNNTPPTASRRLVLPSLVILVAADHSCRSDFNIFKLDKDTIIRPTIQARQWADPRLSFWSCEQCSLLLNTLNTDTVGVYSTVQ